MSEPKKDGFWKSLRPLGPYLAPHRQMFWVGLACAFLTNSLGMLLPLAIKYGIEAIENGKGFRLVIYSVIVLIGIKFIQSIFRYLMRWILIGISRQIEYKIRAELFDHLETLPLAFYQRTRVGDIMSRATNDLNEVRMLLGPAIM